MDPRCERARERATRMERAGTAARERACGGVRGALAPRLRLGGEEADVGGWLELVLDRDRRAGALSWRCPRRVSDVAWTSADSRQPCRERGDLRVVDRIDHARARRARSAGASLSGARFHLLAGAVGLYALCHLRRPRASAGDGALLLEFADRAPAAAARLRSRMALNNRNASTCCGLAGIASGRAEQDASDRALVPARVCWSAGRESIPGDRCGSGRRLPVAARILSRCDGWRGCRPGTSRA